ncbi:uncharacterized protein JCM10292_007193 [Rhodotorula paludigena]|uniref:uncharacterized protein n=1 Tax=Rhodotorula paludigena TaxID=86838 RepID=UPI00317E7EA7
MASSSIGASGRAPDPEFLFARDRYALCAGLSPFYNSHQAGPYIVGCVLRGLLLDVAERPGDGSNADGTVILTHAATFAGSSSDDLHADAHAARVYRAVLAGLRSGSPLAVILGQSYPHLPAVRTYAIARQPAAKYVLAGFYRVAAVWFATTPAVDKVNWSRVQTSIRLRLVWNDPSVPPFWLIQPLFPAVSFSCSTCSRKSPVAPGQVAQCLSPICPTFLSDGVTITTFRSVSKSSPAVLVAYDAPPPLVPTPPLDIPRLSQADTWPRHYATSANHGYMCNSCGELHAQTRWDVAECRACGLVQSLYSASFTAEMLASDELMPSEQCSKGVKVTHRRIPGWHISSYSIDGINSVVRLRPASLDFADAAFLSLQQPATTECFSRGIVRQRTYYGTRTSHFAFNVGAPYDYGIDGVPTFPLPDSTGESVDEPLEATETVQNVLTYLTTVARECMQEHLVFNEGLVIAYKSNNRISWHRDAEQAVRAGIASLSFGAPAYLRFLEVVRPARKTRPRHFSVLLMHGDVCLQLGPMVQRNFKHSLTSPGLRMVITGRYINTVGVARLPAAPSRRGGRSGTRRAVHAQPSDEDCDSSSDTSDFSPSDSDF